MKKRLILQAAVVLGAALCTAAHLPGQKLVWEPVEGQKLRRDLRTEHFLTAELMRTTTNGTVSDSQRHFDIKTVQSLSVTDELRKREGGRPTELRRYYDDTSFEMTRTRLGRRRKAKDVTIKGQGTLMGKGVVFAWIAEDDEYGRHYDAEEGIEELLPGLVADLSLRSLLPPGPVELGETWKLEPRVLGQLFATGGDTNYQLQASEGHSLLRTLRLGMGLHMASVFGHDDQGEVTAMLSGTEEIDGRKLALIDLQFDVQAEHDVTELASRGMTIQDLGRGFRLDSAKITLALEGSGTLRWDLDGGHLYDTRDLQASERVSTTLVQVREREDGQDSTTQELVMVGSLKHSVSCKREP